MKAGGVGFKISELSHKIMCGVFFGHHGVVQVILIAYLPHFNL